ncbi:MAG TPA: CDGSH iron-sulfur domain-containing protein [Polyangia bacterium]
MGDNEQADASAGGAGAPPPEDEANRVAADLTREYAGRGIRVQWYASRCVHSGACIMALPKVFNPMRRPWVDLTQPSAEADAVAEAVLRCPTGALHYVRLDGGPQETAADPVQITQVANGPHLLRGDIQIFDENGRLLRRDTRVALCRCGRSLHMPFCDNSHRATGFREPRSST